MADDVRTKGLGAVVGAPKLMGTTSPIRSLGKTDIYAFLLYKLVIRASTGNHQLSFCLEAQRCLGNRSLSPLYIA